MHDDATDRKGFATGVNTVSSVTFIFSRRIVSFMHVIVADKYTFVVMQ